MALGPCWKGLGSPPHMRGKAVCADSQPVSCGITPAHAGKSAPQKIEVPVPLDHPRTCGEKAASFASCAACAGSPPHMRGKAGIFQPRGASGGITPAHAGKSTKRFNIISRNRDHPRTCGEKASLLTNPATVTGSPPHMRGKGSPGIAAGLFCGITPAHAGKRRTTSSGPGLDRDHPRTCGEKVVFLELISENMGSPPHMRGKDSESLEIQALIFSSAHFPFNF